jgi:hypothetical protein
MRRAGEQYTIINIYNIYNPPLFSYNEKRKKGILLYLRYALRISEEYIVIKDFNLHYLL